MAFLQISMRSIMHFCSLVLFFQISLCQVEGESVEWKYTYDQDPLAVLRVLEPAGDEDRVSKLYVCRVMHSGHWVPGKLYLHNSEYKYKCHIAEGSEHGYTIGKDGNIQVFLSNFAKHAN